MKRFVTFVDGSNLYGVLRHLNVKVKDYEKLFSHIFAVAVKQWGVTWLNLSATNVQHARTYWYVLADIDRWNLEDARTLDHLRERFNAAPDMKKLWLEQAGKKPKIAAVHDQAAIEREAFSLWFEDFKAWYGQKARAIESLRRFCHGIEASTEFIEFRRCGRWKVDPVRKSVQEKGVDTSFAVDMVTMTDLYDVVLLISGDADSIPSLEYVKSRGRHVGVVEFLKGYPPERRGKNFASALNLAADFVVQIYEMDLVSKGIAEKAQPDEPDGDLVVIES